MYFLSLLLIASMNSRNKRLTICFNYCCIPCQTDADYSVITAGFPELIIFDTSILLNLPTLWGKLMTWLWLVEPREVRLKLSPCLYIYQMQPIPNPITVRLIMI